MGTPRTKPRAAPIHGEARPPTPSRPLVRARATSRAAPACSLRSGRCAAPARQAAYRGGRRLPCRLRQRPLSRAKCRRPAPPSRPARAPRGGRPAHTGRGEWETSVPERRSIPSVWAHTPTLSAGLRHCAESPGHRVNTRGKGAVNTAERRRVQRSTCPLERELGGSPTHTGAEPWGDCNLGRVTLRIRPSS